MIAYEEYRTRLDQCLDERREPLDDGEIVAFLDANPECLEEFADLRADVRAVTQISPPAPSGARPQLLTVAAACLVIGFAVSQLLTGNNEAAPVHSPHADSPQTGSPPQTGSHQTGSPQTDSHQTGSTASNQPTPARRSRIVSASLKEVEPRLHAAASYTLHEPLVQTNTITLEAYEQRSELR